ncbi:MAG: CCA tRNA nucleotidyltransferase [Pseudomonadota bacterium]
MTRLTDHWVTAPGTGAVMAALGQGYFVGGCVRNALMRLPASDIDIATPLLPDEVVRRLEDANLKVIPTGLAHGTVTAVADGEPIEVTTFRRDVQTDGRHAVVAFTDEIAVDASRRDFTMNALYADASGLVIDPLGGLRDLEARLIRFIGDPGDRIREDFLRILRFFRFHAWYGAPGIDADGLAACADLADGLAGLARERVGWEFRKLLSAADPAPAVAAMQVAGVLHRCLPGAEATSLAPLIDAEQRAGREPDWRIRLAALGSDSSASQLKLSRTEERFLEQIRAAQSAASDAEAAYRQCRDAAIAAALIRASVTGEDLGPAMQAIDIGATAVFPLKAKDLIAVGHSPGPDLGSALRRAEDRWVASGFELDQAPLIEFVRPK